MPLTPAEVAEIADDVAAGDKAGSVNGRSYTAHSLSELAEYENHRTNKDTEATSKPHFGLRFSVMKPGGCG